VVFDRCDDAALRVVDSAIGAARGLGHNYLGTEHVLFALAEHRDLLPSAVVASMLPAADVIRSAIVSVIGESLRRDAEVLRTVGIDLEQVRSAVRRTFGEEAIARLARRGVHQPWQPWRRPSRRCTSLLAGNLTVATRLKRAFEIAGRHAERRPARQIDPACLLLGVVEVEGALANRLLFENGVDPDDIREVLVSRQS
jgi:ATP-dependent Clp protease ATP-binding subunit ClpA